MLSLGRTGASCRRGSPRGGCGGNPAKTEFQAEGVRDERRKIETAALSALADRGSQGDKDALRKTEVAASLACATV